MRKRKKLMVFIIGCMALLLIGSSLAIWSGKLQQVNQLKADTMSAKIVYYHNCNFEELTVGDAITFRAGDSLVTHRITTVNKDSGTVVTKGDNNETEDPNPVLANEIVGKATGFAIPYAGYFVTYGKKPVAIVVMAAILLINYVLEKLFSRQKGEKKREKKKE